MNLDNMRQLRASLRSKKNLVGFDMRSWFRHNGRQLQTPASICKAAETHPCGTVACLAGHAALLAWQSKGKVGTRRVGIANAAQEWLELTETQACRLFYGRWSKKDDNLSSITKSEAIAELSRLINNGVQAKENLKRKKAMA